MRRIFFKFFALIFFLTISFAQESWAQEWKQLPLRTPAQKAAATIGGEGMQMIQAVAYAPSNPQTVYFSADTAQIWKSTDGGSTWKMKHKGFLANGALSLVVDPNNENIVLASGAGGTELENLPAGANPLSGIFRTMDGGESWKLIKQMAYYGDHEGVHFAFDPNGFDGIRKKTIYAASYRDGLWKSTDGGDTWENLGLQGIRIQDIKLSVKIPYRVLVCTVNGLYRYDAKTMIITKIGAGLPSNPRCAVIDPVNPQNVYVTANEYGVYFSNNGGENFILRSNGLPLGQHPYINLSISPVNSQYLYVSIGFTSLLNPYWSHDGGLTWYKPQTLDEKKMSLFGDQRFFAGPIEPHPYLVNVALAAANGGARIIKTGNGGQSWSYSSNGYTGGRRGSPKTSIGYYNNPLKMVFFLQDFGPIMTEDGGQSWRFLPIPRVLNQRTTLMGVVDSTEKTGRIITAIGNWTTQCIAVSKDNGQTWTVFPETQDEYCFMDSHPQNPNVIYGYGWKSEDWGDTWQKLSKKVMAVYEGNGDMVFAVDDLGAGKSALAVSVDRGVTWSTPYMNIPLPAKAIQVVEVDPQDPQHIYLATTAGLYIYDNGNWLRKKEESGYAADRFGLYVAKCVVVDPYNPDVVYAGRWVPWKGHANGVFQSVDRGKTWKNITYNLGPEINCWSLSISPYDGTVYFGSSHGTWALPAPYLGLVAARK